ncbi:phosphotransferase enzyme family protein [Treponema sp.]|uniref:phosphotransferase enzyme family protein n=1 Tax=Treponema sp. TaxID=166 RepID=UPI003EFFEA25
MEFDLGVFEKVAVSALEKYGWQNTDKPELIVLSENATYMVKNTETGKKDGVMRVSRPFYHTLDELNSEMKWLRQINEYTPLIVANPIAGLDGNPVQQVAGPDGNTYFVVICEFLTGKSPDENNEEQMVRQFRYLGETTAYLHRQTEIWNGTKKLDRIEWTFDNIIGKTPKWGDWRKFPAMTSEACSLLEKIAGIIEKRLDRYGKNENNYGLIHADLRLANLLIEGEQIKVIDFDDCGFGWHLHDLASALSFIEEKPIVPNLVNAWLSGYKKVLPFTDTDFEEIDTFIMMRRLQLTAWLGSHQQSGPVAQLSVGWMDGTMELAERYKRLFG